GSSEPVPGHPCRPTREDRSLPRVRARGVEVPPSGNQAGPSGQGAGRV
ncbi:MAG: hypothetical protein AVDCRST_MAG77-5255, partial [uncultured Chloroflexi bacterium]